MRHKTVRTAARRDRAESHLLTFLVAFAVTVIATRVYLGLADYGFVLLTVFIYLYFRRPRQPDPRQAVYHA